MRKSTKKRPQIDEKRRQDAFGAETGRMGDLVQAAGPTLDDLGFHFRAGNTGK